MSEELNGNGHCETLIVDDEPTEGVSGSTSARITSAGAEYSSARTVTISLTVLLPSQSLSTATAV